MQEEEIDTKIILKEDLLRASHICPDCKNTTLKSDEFLTLEKTYESRSYCFNNLDRVDDTKYDIIFKCYTCSSFFNLEELNLRLSGLIHMTSDLRSIAQKCNPHEGQTWAAKSGFKTEVCPINGNPCYDELWKVCPHIGNNVMTDFIKLNTNLVIADR